MGSNLWITGLQTCVSVTLLARGWLTWRWDSPIRGLFWNEGWWGGRIDWTKFATGSDEAITRGLETLGIVLMGCAVIPWLIDLPKLRWSRWLLIPLAGVLGIDAFARFIDSGNQFGMGIEHSSQWGCPLLLLAAVQWPRGGKAWCVAAMVATMLTFVGHGLYAFGFHPVPLKYRTMTSALLGLSEVGTLRFLYIAGILDFVAAAALFLKPLQRFALYYMIVWGAATAFARVCTGPSLDPWLMETVVRSSHWMIPLLILALIRMESPDSKE